VIVLHRCKKGFKTITQNPSLKTKRRDLYAAKQHPPPPNFNSQKNSQSFPYLKSIAKAAIFCYTDNL